MITKFYVTVAELDASIGHDDGESVHVAETDSVYVLDRSVAALVANDETSRRAQGGGYFQVSPPPLVFYGATPGVAQNESIELATPYTPSGYLDIGSFPGRLIAVRIEADGAGAGIDTGGANTKLARTLVINRTTAYQTALDAIALDSAGVAAGSGDASTANWTLVATHAAAGGGKPERIALTFATGAGNQHKCNVKVSVEVQAGAAFPA